MCSGFQTSFYHFPNFLIINLVIIEYNFFIERRGLVMRAHSYKKGITLSVYLFVISFLESQWKVGDHSFNLMMYVTIHQLIYIPVGCILAWDNSAEFRVEWKRMILFGVPVLYLISVPYIIRVESVLPSYMVTNGAVGVVSQIILGYIIITSLYVKQITYRKH